MFEREDRRQRAVEPTPNRIAENCAGGTAKAVSHQIEQGRYTARQEPLDRFKDDADSGPEEPSAEDRAGISARKRESEEVAHRQEQQKIRRGVTAITPP